MYNHASAIMKESGGSLCRRGVGGCQTPFRAYSNAQRTSHFRDPLDQHRHGRDAEINLVSLHLD